MLADLEESLGTFQVFLLHIFPPVLSYRIFKYMYIFYIAYVCLTGFGVSFSFCIVDKSSVRPNYWPPHRHSTNHHQLCNVPWRAQLLWGKLQSKNTPIMIHLNIYLQYIQFWKLYKHLYPKLCQCLLGVRAWYCSIQVAKCLWYLEHLSHQVHWPLWWQKAGESKGFIWTSPGWLPRQVCKK